MDNIAHMQDNNDNSNVMVMSLAALCQREGGHVPVAQALGVANNTIYQIIKRVELPSGRPRDVGAKLRKRLDEVYPNWLLLSQVRDFELERRLTGIRQVLLALPPEIHAVAVADAIQAMLVYLPRHTKPAPQPSEAGQTPRTQNTKH